MKRNIVIFSISVICVITGFSSVKIVPQPKVLQQLERECRLVPEAVIVVGAKADITEQAAAERLQTLVLRRFKIKLPITPEGEVKQETKQLILTGVPDHHVLLKNTLQAKNISLAEDSLGTNGYQIEVLTAPERASDTVVITGKASRGVLYGQDVFFDLLEKRGNTVVFPAVSVQDWPDISWRGRPHSVLQHHLDPGAFESYIRARLNFTDVRDNPNRAETVLMPARKSSMGCPCDVPLDKEFISRHIKNSHRHGFFVYGTVSCGVPEEKFNQVLNTYRDLIELGVDGLWISFDDTGEVGDSSEITRMILDLGKQHNIQGRKIAVTPPGQPYQKISHPWNYRTAKVAGMEDITWFFTRVPCETDVKIAEDMGLKRLPGWWHNLVRINAGFTYSGHILAPLRKNKLPGYLDLQPLASGWGLPSYKRLRNAAQHTDTVLMWGLCSGFPVEYELSVLGIWAWHPGAHNWQDTRESIYRFVYGPSGVQDLVLFDDLLKKLNEEFFFSTYSEIQYYTSPNWPGRLKNIERHQHVLKKVEEMETIYQRIAPKAREESALLPERLERYYLEPMAASLRIARIMANSDYPEYRYPNLENQMLDLMEAGRTEEAKQLVLEVKSSVEANVKKINDELRELELIPQYAEKWQKKVADFSYWTKWSANRTTNMQKTFKDQVQRPVTDWLRDLPINQDVTEQDRLALFVECNNPPAGKVLVKFNTEKWLEKAPVWRGNWAIGLYSNQVAKTAAIISPGRKASSKGAYAEVSADMEIPKYSGRLLLDVFVQDTRQNGKGDGYRIMKLVLNGVEVWQEDVVVNRAGRAWVTVDITEKVTSGSQAELCFRVEDLKSVKKLIAAFVGDFQLRTE